MQNQAFSNNLNESSDFKELLLQCKSAKYQENNIGLFIPVYNFAKNVLGNGDTFRNYRHNFAVFYYHSLPHNHFNIYPKQNCKTSDYS